MAAAADGRKVIDLQQKFFAFTMDSIMSIFFGRDTNTLTGVKDTYADAFDSTHRAAFLYGIGNLPFWILISFLPFPFGNLMPARSAFNSLPELILRRFTKSGQSFSTNNTSLRKASDAFIRAKMNDPDLKNQEDMLALFLRAKSPSGEPMAQP